jgi:hypothetical protein
MINVSNVLWHMHPNVILEGSTLLGLAKHRPCSLKLKDVNVSYTHEDEIPSNHLPLKPRQRHLEPASLHPQFDEFVQGWTTERISVNVTR